MAGWVNRSQQDVIDYLQTENPMLRRGSVESHVASGPAAC